MIRRPPRSTRTDTLFPYTTLVRSNVRQLIAALDRLAPAYGDEKLAGMKTLADAARDKRAAADLAARETFDGLSIPGVGGETWRALWEAARRYSEQTAYPGAPFPPTGDEACVLCHQALHADAKDRLGRSEEHTSELQSLMRKSYA